MSKGTTFIANQERIFNLPSENINFQSLVNLFAIRNEEHRNFPCLEQAIRDFDFDFYNTLLPAIAKWASDHTKAKLIVEPLYAGKTGKIVYTAAQARYILANAFFLNTAAGYGNLDLNHLYNSLFSTVAVERIRCLIEYFRLSLKENDDREITIERYSFNDELPNWSEQHIPIQSSKIKIFDGRMEDVQEAQGFVDFANKHIHIHRIIPSATQEEVLFSCCPEAFLSILLCETLRNDEIVILRGCKRFIEYDGYGETFRYTSSYQESNQKHIQDILVMDACYEGHFTKKHIDRDLGKAWAAFSKSENESIVTGKWGCGVFGGDPLFKFLQQISAAMILGNHFKQLYYSARDQKLASTMAKILQKLEKKNKTVSDVYTMMVEYHGASKSYDTQLEFVDYCKSWLKSSHTKSSSSSR